MSQAGARVTEAESSPLLRTLIALAALGLCLPLFYLWRSHRARADVETAGKKLTELFSDRSIPPLRQGGFEDLFVTLITNPEGRPILAGLARDNPWLAFHEGRHTVFYVYRDASAYEGTKPLLSSHIGRVTTDPGKASDWRNQWGCGLPDCIALKGLKVEGDKVWIDFETSPDPRWHAYLETEKLESGAKYRSLYDVGPIRLDAKQLIKDARRQ
jgi:hypothetical protein